ncbi:MAG: helix-turn-helix transcriptional regulator [Candidatus Aminicenantes bacterium]|nr:helix-turn-helix transcriptional regulator [Candidatus Aminicenantes bacterium]
MEKDSSPKILTNLDELLLLVVLRLEGNAYGVTIRRELSTTTGKDWAIGAVYDPLYRLEQRGLIISSLSHPTQERGGRSKRMFRLTQKGRDALLAHKNIRDKLWHVIKETE